MNSLPAAKPPVRSLCKAPEGCCAMHRFIVEQDQYQRFLITGLHSSKESGRQNIHDGSQGVPLRLPNQPRGKAPAIHMRAVEFTDSEVRGATHMSGRGTLISRTRSNQNGSGMLGHSDLAKRRFSLYCTACRYLPYCFPDYMCSRYTLWTRYDAAGQLLRHTA